MPPVDAEHRPSLAALSSSLPDAEVGAEHTAPQGTGVIFTSSPSLWHCHVVPWCGTCSTRHPLTSPGGDQGAGRLAWPQARHQGLFVMGLLMSSITVPQGETETKDFKRKFLPG